MPISKVLGAQWHRCFSRSVTLFILGIPNPITRHFFDQIT